MPGKNPSHLSRRSLIASAAATTAVTAHAVPGLAAGGAPQHQPASLRYQDANLPTPREQTVVIEQSTNNIWDSFNPFIPNGENGSYGLTQLCREYMFYANFLTGEVTPWLAESYEYNADFTQCTLHLNPAVTWNDGEPFTANDVVFTQNMLMANPQLNGAAGTIRDVSAVTATDDHTVVWDLPTANPRFHYRFLAGIIADGLRVMPQHIWEGEDPGTFKFNPPVQTGPYVLRESSDSLLYYLWEKSPNYWNAANFDPAPQYVMFRQEGEVDAEVQSFLAGNIDAPGAIDYLNQQMIESQYENTARFDFPDPCPRGLHFNCASESPLLNTAEGRWALSHLLDREVIASTIWQPSTRPANYPWADYSGWAPWAPDEVVSQFDWSFSVDKANEILDGMGATERDGDTRILNGQPLRLTMITSAQTTGYEYVIGQSFASTAKEAGIDIEVKSLPGSAHGDVFNVGDYDISSRWICGMQFDPNQLFTQFHSRNFKPIGERVDGDAASTRLQSPELDALIEQLDVIDVEAEASKQVFYDALSVWLTELPMAPIIQTTYPMFYNTTYWTGYPSAEDPYTIPARWWGQFMFAIGRLQPTGAS